MNKSFHIVLLLCALLCLSCSRQKLHEAQSVVAAADSLRTVGQPYTDSTQLAQAYTTLKHWQTIHSDDYARACYYYGRLLRSAEHYPEAMTCFINATHSRSKDHNILARSYSNMGIMCRMEGNLNLSLEMHKLSANQFKLAEDTILYYYALNDMALVCAEQNDMDAVNKNLALIEKGCTDKGVLLKILETKAIAYRNVAKYDSTLYYVDQLERLGYSEPTGYVIKAQAFNRSGYKDSALYYAQKALACPCSLNDSVNMLFITSHNDSTLDGDSILSITSERVDKQFAYTHQQEGLSHAVEILQQDLQRKPDRRWLYAVFITLFVIGGVITIVLRFTKKHRMAKKRQMRLVKQQIAQGKEVLAQTQIRHETLASSTKTMLENRRACFDRNCDMLRNSPNIMQELCWKDYQKMCMVVNEQLFFLADKLKLLHVLNEKEIRFCILIAIQCTQRQIADILPYSLNGIGKFKYIISKRLNLDARNLRDFLIKLAIE